MSLLTDLLGKSPFGPLVGHAKKVHACVKQVKPLIEACVNEDADEIHRLQDLVSKLEYEADVLKHEIRENLPRRYFTPVDKADLDKFLHCQDNIADHVLDLAVILLIRRTKIHSALVQELREFVDQVLKVSDTVLLTAEEMEPLMQASFGGAEAKSVLDRIKGLGEGEWLADRMQRKISQHIYGLEKELDPITIVFYEKILQALSGVADAAENTGDVLRRMIVKG